MELPPNAAQPGRGKGRARNEVSGGDPLMVGEAEDGRPPKRQATAQVGGCVGEWERLRVGGGRGGDRWVEYLRTAFSAVA